MLRRSLLKMPLALPGAGAGRKWNFVFILADDLGWADTSPYGADLHETPNLGRLAASGIRFTRAYSAGPVCSPTRASIHTGKYPARLHMTIWREASRRPVTDRPLIPPVTEEDLPHSEVTFANVLRDAGYFTAHVGKWHLGNAEHYPEAHGFDVNIGGSLWGAPQSFFWPYRGRRFYGGEYRYVPGLAGGRPGEYLTDRLTTEALRVVEAARERPFFLNLAFHTVHTPIEGKPELVERYRTRIRPGMKHTNPGYAAMVHSMDENVGRVLESLERLGVADRTVVIFTSDNGGFINRWQGTGVTSNHPLRSGKGSLYEGGIRVPLIVRWPGETVPGAVCHEPVCSVDFYRTILEIAGPGGDPGHNRTVDGSSLVPLLRNPGGRLDRPDLFFHYPHYYETTTPVSAVVSREWKLLEYLTDGMTELYNLESDAAESNDMAGQRPGIAARLRSRLEEWRRNVGAQMPAPNPAFGRKQP